MTDAERQAESDKIAERRNREIEEAVAAFALTLAILTDRWNSVLDDFLDRDWRQAHPSQLLNFLENHLSAQVDTAGYPVAVRDLIAAYDGAYNAANEQLAALGIDGAVDTSQASGIKDVDSGRLSRLGSNLALDLAGTVLAACVLNQPKKDILETAGRSLDNFEATTERTAENGLYVFNRAVAWLGTHHLIADFKYQGPADSRTRPFCMEHVGNTYSREEILNMTNGNLDPVWLHCGGFACRHSWVAQTAKQ